jgi:hypothetical protein
VPSSERQELLTLSMLPIAALSGGVGCVLRDELGRRPLLPRPLARLILRARVRAVSCPMLLPGARMGPVLCCAVLC